MIRDNPVTNMTPGQPAMVGQSNKAFIAHFVRDVRVCLCGVGCQAMTGISARVISLIYQLIKNPSLIIQQLNGKTKPTNL